MIEVFDLTKSYGERVLFRNVAFSLRKGERIGLVGRNGHGKSTLLRIIVGEEAPDSGRIAVPKNYRTGYLHQLINCTETDVLREACKGLPQGQKDDTWKAKKILMGLGFSEEDFEKPPGMFSGGYQMRIELTKVLVSDPDMLLLDEPTNFLDIVSIRWLEAFLKNWKGEMVVISHDRRFMDSVSTHIVGIHRTAVRKVRGTTGKYYSDIAKDEEIYERRRLNEEKQRKQIEEYISSFRAKARRAKSVQSSIKRLDKMEKTDKLGGIQTLDFSFNPVPFRPPVVMEAQRLSFSYSGEEPYLIDDLTFTVERGDKICIAGANGKGKTTLIKMLSGKIKPVKGEIKNNPQVITAYYEQGNTARLDENNSIEDEIQKAHSGKAKTEIRSICGAMMFSGDDVLKKISVLSGGERSRVLLAKALLSPSNFLLLDEPTHHLDMESCSALFEAVKEYPGAAVVVTHDEYFLYKVATKLIMFMADDIILFPGNYSEFLDQIGWEEGQREKETQKKQDGKKAGSERTKNKKDQRRLRAEKRNIRRVKIRPLEEKIEKTEKKINIAEKEHTGVLEQLVESSEKQESERIADLSKRASSLKSQIDELYEQLGKLMGEYEEIKKDIDE